MSPRPALFTQTEIERALRAAKAVGYRHVELIPSTEGLKIVCDLDARDVPDAPKAEELE